MHGDRNACLQRFRRVESRVANEPCVALPGEHERLGPFGRKQAYCAGLAVDAPDYTTRLARAGWPRPTGRAA